MNDIWYGIALYASDDLCARKNACEVIATYNAMAYLNGGYSPKDFPDMLMDFEGRGTALLGNWGASPLGVASYLERNGYSTSFVSGADLGENGKGYLKLQSEYDVFIMSTWNSE